MERVTPEHRISTYTVMKGDTLSSIARKLTGSADYGAIYIQNKALIGDNPNNITPGMQLIIPGSAATGEDA